MAGVGTKKVYENDRVVVWELELDPGEKIPLHTHVLDYMFYVYEATPSPRPTAREMPARGGIARSSSRRNPSPSAKQRR